MASNHPQSDLLGENKSFEKTIEEIRKDYGFDFVALGLTAFVGAPLKWVYGTGATSERYKRIVLAPGHGIGGIVIKSGKPMMFSNIDEQIDPREYSSYPIVFAEDLRSFCALPLLKEGRIVGALLCGDRSIDPKNEIQYRALTTALKGSFLDFKVRTTDFLYRSTTLREEGAENSESVFTSSSSLSQTINAQENERRRISRELHDGIAQELLSISLLIRELRTSDSSSSNEATYDEIHDKVGAIMNELHNLSVELRPSTLDHLGIVPALKSQAMVFEKSYGAKIVIEDNLSHERFNRALETQVYRICQEAILNACKYSGSDMIFVELEDADDWLCATITDKGEGFDVSRPVIKGSGCGLTGIHERANLIGATLTIESGPEGTRVCLIAPLVLKEGD